MENKIWHSSQRAKDDWEKAEKEFQMGMIWGFPKRELREDENVKLAWVKIKGYRTMLGVDNITMKGYAIHPNYPTFLIPLEPVIYDEFERWCTSFDV